MTDRPLEPGDPVRRRQSDGGLSDAIGVVDHVHPDGGLVGVRVEIDGVDHGWTEEAANLVRVDPAAGGTTAGGTTAADWLAADIAWLDRAFGPVVLPECVHLQVRESASDGKLGLVLRGSSGPRYAVVVVTARKRSDGFILSAHVRDRWHPGSRGAPIDLLSYPALSPDAQTIVDELAAWVQQ